MLVDRASVTTWLDGYVRAWKTYDPWAIGDLFSENATYAYSPFSEPIQERAPAGLGRAAVAVVRRVRAVRATRLISSDEHVGDRE